MSSYSFKLPDLGEGTVESEIVEWRVRVGDMVNVDQPLVDIMTDKATIEITAPVSGKVISLGGQPATSYQSVPSWWSLLQARINRL